MTTAVTAGLVKRSVLEPVLDARALNLEQKRLMFDPSPEVDSQLESIDLLATMVAGNDQALAELDRLRTITRRIATSNGAEGARERAVAGDVDQLVRDLRSAELRGAGAASAIAIARAARDPLHALSEASRRELLPLAAAAFTLTRLVDQAPSGQVLSPTVQRELGARLYGLLADVVATGLEPTP